MKITQILIGLLALIAFYSAIDGVTAMITGHYISFGGREDQLGPWANVVSSIGIDPRSTLMKVLFVLMGTANLIATLAFLSNIEWGRSALIATSMFMLWYLPFGTIAGLAQLIIIFFFA
jgi:hypothetical protein